MPFLRGKDVFIAPQGRTAGYVVDKYPVRRGTSLDVSVLLRNIGDRVIELQEDGFSSMADSRRGEIVDHLLQRSDERIRRVSSPWQRFVFDLARYFPDLADRPVGLVFWGSHDDISPDLVIPFSRTLQPKEPLLVVPSGWAMPLNDRR